VREKRGKKTTFFSAKARGQKPTWQSQSALLCFFQRKKSLPIAPIAKGGRCGEWQYCRKKKKEQSIIDRVRKAAAVN